jgi:hypothetical protein
VEHQKECADPRCQGVIGSLADQERVTELGRELVVSGEYDVVVAGGGIAGVAAAVAAARHGATVCLLERAFALGGLATLGNVIVWLPLCDGRGRQVIGGIAEELLLLSVGDLDQDSPGAGFRGVPACWGAGGDSAERRKVRYRVSFNPVSYMLALEALVTHAGVTLLYDTRVCAVRQVDRSITHLIVENKSGRSAVACRAVVDATGDADVCFLAGEDTESVDGNVACGWFYTMGIGGLKQHPLSRRYSPLGGRDERAEGPFFRGDDAAQVTAQVLASRELIRQKLADLRTGESPDVQIISLPTLACFRMTRRLVGSFSLGERHMHEWFPETVGLTGDWRKPGPVYAIPLKALCGAKVCNLLVAGRGISADRTVWDVTRAIPTCALTGEAAGTAAALAVSESDSSVHELAPSVVQDHLRRAGALIDPLLVAPAD